MDNKEAEDLYAAIPQAGRGARACSQQESQLDEGTKSLTDCLSMGKSRLFSWGATSGLHDDGHLHHLADLMDELNAITTLDQLFELIEQYLERSCGNFRVLGEILSRLSRDNVIALLQGVIEGELFADNKIRDDSVYLHRQSNCNLLIRLTGKDSNSKLYANEFDVFILNLSTQAVAVPHYHTSIDRRDLFCCPGALKPQGLFSFEPGKLYYFEAYTDLFDFGQTEEAGAFLLVVHSDARGWLSWTFDPITLQASEPICTDVTASRMQLYIRLLGEMQCRVAVDVLQELATSDYVNFVRWEAIESLAKIDDQICLQLLEQLAQDDPDAMIRQAARRSLLLKRQAPIGEA